MALQAGLRTLHEIGPELKRAISGNLEADFASDLEEPQHRRPHSLFNNLMTVLGGSTRDNHVPPRQQRSVTLMPHSDKDGMPIGPHRGNVPISTQSNGGPVQRRLPQLPVDGVVYDQKPPLPNDYNRYLSPNRNLTPEDDWYERRDISRGDDRWRDDGSMDGELREPFLISRRLGGPVISRDPRGVAETYEDIYRPAPGGKSVRVPYAQRPQLRPTDSGEERLAERLVGEALGLGRYMDERVVEAARREIAEAYSLEESELERAAATLADQRYMEHLGMQRSEVCDFNRYSASALLRPATGQKPHEDDLLLVTTL